ncbi:SDR family NAD(P)-dependent oxidoreductase [Jannaschia seohaensis]|uniref:Meso-butanediol dehydrogenase / (S,S)-butanediol dehydrogenase / diacetyl reductase n=1 Tax=Jannaschia seohaensis TaxID=475081 RepID=A0A2Y9AVL8_9RHOB|nr:SDR family oxidoreductase [Jannaschia seohaensis]PWJ17034.1 meso-butanediol dehydrogenase/(S,S)-butanediol dehydrogenase/diacetyl reductase [Jannaschia seohaensis]SSA48371.1 meso-butanediol dehydrogenase / (S,S)-butanediol dehydrogenase / diacetyl reductase [Jannaschia seohaensis]
MSTPRTVIVTGGGSGIGAATARRFAADGATVFCADIDREAAARVAAEIGESGGRAEALRCDVTDESSVAGMVARVTEATGRIDCVAANAGAMVEGGILALDLEDWRRALDVNATGAFLTARATLPELVKTSGALVFTASTVGLAGMKGVAAYSAAKGAVVALTRQLAADFAAEGVRVNAVAPGAVRTPLSESQFRARATDEADLERLLSGVIQRYPLSRWGRAEEIAEAIHFLGTDRASWITGHIMPIEGGLLQTR